MTNQKPLVSVLLISMNHENYIEQAINSILSQSYSNFEIIFLDNNSKDKTFEIGDLLLKKSNVNYVGIKNDSNKGVSENLNILVDNAKGTYVSILSGDDWYELKNIELRLDFLTKNNLDVVLADGYKYIQNSGIKKNVYPNKRKKRVILTINDYFKNNIVGNITCNVGFFCKRDILIKHPFDTNLQTEDWDINLRLSKAGYQFGFLDKKTFNYRILKTSLSHNINSMKDAYLKVTNKYLEEIKANSKYLNTYELSLLNYDILLLKQQNHKSKAEYLKLQQLQTQYNNKKYRGLKRIFKNFILNFKK